MEVSMQLDPKVSMILNIVLFALQSLAGATWLSGTLDPHHAGLIMGILGWITTVLNFVLHAYSPPQAGPLAKAALFIVGGIALFMLLATPALAQEPRVPAGQKGAAAQSIRTAPGLIPGTTVPCDPANLIPGCRNPDGTVDQAAGSRNPLANLTDEVLAKLLADFTYASARAHATGNAVTAPCWDAWVKLLTNQTASLKDAAGNVLSKPDPHLILDAELASELISQLQPNSDLSIACAPTLQASQRNISTLVGAVLSGGALGLFKLP
jgi:hypothetical protein